MAAPVPTTAESEIINPQTTQPILKQQAPAEPASGWGASIKSACTRTCDAVYPFFKDVLLLGGMGVTFPAGAVYLTNQLIKECPQMKGALIWMPAMAISAVSVLLILKAGNNLMNYFKNEQNGFAFRLFGYDVLSLAKTV